jgi:hypothetical protein
MVPKKCEKRTIKSRACVPLTYVSSFSFPVFLAQTKKCVSALGFPVQTYTGTKLSSGKHPPPRSKIYALYPTEERVKGMCLYVCSGLVPAESSCPGVRSSGSPSRGPWCATPPSSSWTRPPPLSTTRARRLSRYGGWVGG